SASPRQAPATTTDSPPSAEDPKSTLSLDTSPGKSYVIPGVEIIGYLLLLNLYDRNFTEPKAVYRTNGHTFREHLTDSKWVIDDDQFVTNQFVHPYSGTIYYGLARSTVLIFWDSVLCASAG